MATRIKSGDNTMEKETNISDSRFHVGDIIRFNGTKHLITGRIKYKDKEGYLWDEYTISQLGTRSSAWLSIDEDECVYWQSCEEIETDDEWELLEKGTESVKQAFQKVDVTPGESARFWEYVNTRTGEYYSIEKWSDETEYCKGEKIDPNSISLVQKGSGETEIKDTGLYYYIGILILGAGYWLCKVMFFSPAPIPLIETSLEKSSDFEIATYITGIGDKKFANVYRCSNPAMDADSIARFIITQREGEVEKVEKLYDKDGVDIEERIKFYKKIEKKIDNNETGEVEYLNYPEKDNIVILTDKEFCFIYPNSEQTENVNERSDSTQRKELYVLSATREWMLKNYREPLYQADSVSQQFYIETYEGLSFEADSTNNPENGKQHYRRYFHYSSPSFSKNYDSFINDIRESSRQRRRTSGGHRGGGK